MIKLLQILLIIITFGHIVTAANVLPEPCTSVGEDSSFEYINQVVFGGLDHTSGNNGGYAEFKDEIISVSSGSFQDITLVPGYLSTNYKEGWNIWIDYNKDGYFDNETENVLSESEVGQISSTIHLSTDAAHIGLTRMRISMQYIDGAEPCENVSFGEVEDYYIDILPSSSPEPCKAQSFDDFESGYSTWIDGGSDCSLINRGADIENWSIRLRDNSSSSTLTSKTFDLSNYNRLEVHFDYDAYSMEEGEDFWLQISTDGGYSYATIQTWTSGKEFINGTQNHEEVMLKDIKFTDEVKIRWRCDASANADQVYLDNISIDACFVNDEEDRIDLLEVSDMVIASEDAKTTRQLETRKSHVDIEFDVFPNPSTDYLIFRITERDAFSSEQLRVSLIDMYGQSKDQINLNEESNEYVIDVSQYEKGMYLLLLQNKEELISSKKVMIIK